MYEFLWLIPLPSQEKDPGNGVAALSLIILLLSVLDAWRGMWICMRTCSKNAQKQLARTLLKCLWNEILAPFFIPENWSLCSTDS